MKGKSESILKALAIIARCVGLFPCLIIMSYIITEGYVAENLPFELESCLLLSSLGYLQVMGKDFLQERLQKQRLIRNGLLILLYGAGIAVIGFYIVKVMHEIPNVKVIFAILTIVLYVLTMRAYEEAYYDILTAEMIVGISCIYIVALVLSKISYLSLFYILIIASYIVVNNQASLDRLASRTRDNIPMLENIRKDNMKWVCGVVSIIFIAYPLKGIMGKGIEWLLLNLTKLFFKCMQLIMMLLNKLLGASTLPTNHRPSVQEPMMGLAEEKNSYVETLFVIIGMTLVLVLIIKNRKAIIARIEQILLRLAKLVKEIKQFLFGHKKKQHITGDEYVDVVEELNDGMQIAGMKVVPANKRKWQKQVKRYLKELSEQSNYRQGYQLLLEGARLKGVKMKNSYTPRELVSFIQEQVTLPHLPQSTKVYEYIRYGEGKWTQEELKQLSELLVQLLQVNK